MENHKEYILGRVKVIVGRVSEHDELEVLNVQFWHERFDYDENGDTDSYSRDILNDTYIMGYLYILKDLLKTDTQVFQIIGELYQESWKSWTDCGYEYDARNWLQSTRVKELTGNSLEWFKEEDPTRWSDFTGKEV